MMTFLPYSDFVESAKCLDYKRLGNQRCEAKAILTSLYNNKGWIHHPVTKMWKGYENALLLYYNTIVKEWESRGYKNSMLLADLENISIVYPPWFGDERIHSSHKASLLYKLPDFYSKYGWTEEPQINYYYPVR